MIPICDNCQYSKSDCKGNKSPEKIKCDYYKKPVVFNAKEAATQIAELKAEVLTLRGENEKLRDENDFLKNMIFFYRERLGLD